MGVVHGFVLAGGASRRMGTNKALLKFPNDRPMLETAHQTLQSVCVDVRIVVKADQIDHHWPTEFDYLCESPNQTLRHPLAGVVAALNTLKPDELALFVPCDTPFLCVKTLKQMIDFAHSHRHERVCLVDTDGEKHPLHCLLSRAELARTQRYLDEQRPVRVFAQSFATFVAPSATLRNINQPADMDD